MNVFANYIRGLTQALPGRRISDREVNSAELLPLLFPETKVNLPGFPGAFASHYFVSAESKALPPYFRMGLVKLLKWTDY
jgi:hypothetical protein